MNNLWFLFEGFIAVFGPGMFVILAVYGVIRWRAGRRAKRQLTLLTTKWDAMNTAEHQVLLKNWGGRK